MKKQKASGKLAFNKKALVELNDEQLKAVNGGDIIGAIVSGAASFVRTIPATLATAVVSAQQTFVLTLRTTN